jgi:heterodisulfide reductase subunit D
LNDIPNEVRDSIAEKILKNDNPYAPSNAQKRVWMEEVGFEPPSSGDVLYYVGCTAGLKLPQIAKSTLRVLRASGVNFAVLEDEPCCGSVMLRTGKTEEAEENSKRLIDAIKKSGAKKIIVTCAGCHRTLKKDYPERYDAELPEVLHAMEYMEELLEEGKLRPKGLEELLITYHDPCHSGRELGMYDEPRRIIESIPGVKLVEMETNRDAAMCCGAGGGLRSFDGDLAKKIAVDRIRSAEATGATILATACPFCELNLQAGADLIDSEIRILDVMDLLAKSLEG